MIDKEYLEEKGWTAEGLDYFFKKELYLKLYKYDLIVYRKTSPVSFQFICDVKRPTQEEFEVLIKLVSYGDD